MFSLSSSNDIGKDGERDGKDDKNEGSRLEIVRTMTDDAKYVALPTMRACAVRPGNRQVGASGLHFQLWYYSDCLCLENENSSRLSDGCLAACTHILPFSHELQFGLFIFWEIPYVLPFSYRKFKWF
eukprot:3700519-Amphidinium_carterae.1